MFCFFVLLLLLFFDRESIIGFVDYDDEDEDMFVILGINGKNLVELLDKKMENLFLVVLLISFLLEVEIDIFVKCKILFVLILEEIDGIFFKR